VKVKKDSDYRKKYYTADGEYSSDDDEDDPVASDTKIDHLSSFKDIISYMNPKESINGTLQRLNKSKLKVSTAQRWKMKKQGVVDESSEKITKLTGICNDILTQSGNMNIYELTYEQIKFKIKEMEDKKGAGTSRDAELDMYADDFDEKEKEKKTTVTFKVPAAPQHESEKDVSDESDVMWEYKLTQDENEKVLGPFSTQEMQKKVDNGDFKTSVFVRKIGEERFYSSARIDFELYL
jgi:CD2 antigen cytoplasmic tail-binding protein 2